MRSAYSLQLDFGELQDAAILNGDGRRMPDPEFAGEATFLVEIEAPLAVGHFLNRRAVHENDFCLEIAVLRRRPFHLSGVITVDEHQRLMDRHEVEWVHGLAGAGDVVALLVLNVPLERLQQRTELLKAFDSLDRSIDQKGVMQDVGPNLSGADVHIPRHRPILRAVPVRGLPGA